MLRRDGDADRSRRLDLLTGEDEGLGNGLECALGQLVDVQLVGQSGQEDGELVASHPGHRVLTAYRVDQPVADQLHQIITYGMAVGVVDHLEVVEIDEEHAHRLPDPPGSDQLLIDAVLEQAPVGQPGQRVVPGHVRDLLEQVQVLEGGGGPVGKAAQALVDIGVVVGGRRCPETEAGGECAEERPGSEERGDHRGLGAVLGQELAQGWVVDVFLDDDDLAPVDEPLHERDVGRDGHHVVRRRRIA